VTTKEPEKPKESKDKKESKGNENIFCFVTRKNMKNHKEGIIKLLLSGDIQNAAHKLMRSVGETEFRVKI
jgi:hypothetical protein